MAGNLAAHREQRTSRVVVVWIGGRRPLAVHDHTGRDRRPLRPGQPHLALGNAGGGGVVNHGVSLGGDSDRPGIGAQEPLAAPEGSHPSGAHHADRDDRDQTGRGGGLRVVAEAADVVGAHDGRGGQALPAG